MKKPNFLDGVSYIEPDVVERFVSMDNRLHEKAKKIKAAWLRFGAIAACTALIIGATAAMLIPLMRKDHGIGMEPYSPNGEPWSPVIHENIDEVVLSADEIGDVMGVFTYYKDSTNQYTKVYASSPQYLYPLPLPNAEYLPIYSRKLPEPSKAALESFINEYLDTVTDMFGMDHTAYEIIKEEYGYRAELGDGDERLRFSTRKEYVYFEKSTLHNRRMLLNGEMVSFWESETDEQIKEKLQPTIDYVCDSLGKKYDSVKIVRHYSYDQLKNVTVYLYTTEETILPENFYEAPMSSEYVALTFYTDWGQGTYCNWGGSEDEAFLSSVALFKMVDHPSQVYEVTAKSRMISLEEAEALLKKGYVFGGHSCPLCMAMQPEVDFSEYTCVDIEYVFDDGSCIPFYAFYKYVGETEDGIGQYAKPYVPAVEVKGLEKYFQSQAKEHSD